MAHRKTVVLVIALTVVALLVTQCAPAPVAAPTSAPQPTSAPPATSAPAATTAPKPTIAPTQAPSGAANTLVIVADTSDMISLDPAVSYEFTGDLLVH